MAGAPRVTFEPLFLVFEFFGVSSEGLLPGHKSIGVRGRFDAPDFLA